MAQEAAPGGVALPSNSRRLSPSCGTGKRVEALNDKLLAAGVEAARAKGELEDW